MNSVLKIRHTSSPTLVVSKIVATCDGSDWAAHVYYNDDKYETFERGRTLQEAIVKSLGVGPVS